jgi:hypothetical protein
MVLLVHATTANQPTNQHPNLQVWIAFSLILLQESFSVL